MVFTMGMSHVPDRDCRLVATDSHLEHGVIERSGFLVRHDPSKIANKMG